MADPVPNLKDQLLNDLDSAMGAASDRIGDNTAPSAFPLIPDHRLLRCIGRGSYGEVWLAQNALGTFRAVKIVRREAFDSDRPYEREFAGIRRFEPVSRTHPSQLNVLHVGRDDTAGLFYYVMELADDSGTGAQPAVSGEGTSTRVLDAEAYVPGTIRSEIHERGRLPCAECISIATALATALDHLHRHGLVHRDIKPSNIIFVNGIPKLADIGLVTRLEATVSFVGTEGYVPPEGPGTPQADIYSLGKVLYEMSTGRDRQDYPELPTNLIEAPIAERSALAELNEVIVKACHVDSRKRYETAAELHAELALLQSGKSVTRMRTVEQSLRTVKRVGALVTVLTLVIGAGWLWQTRQTTRIRQLATEKARLAEENNERVIRLDIANGTRLLDNGDPSGALLWFADALPRLTHNPTQESIHRIRIQQTLNATPRLLRVFAHESSVQSAAFSPDGEYIATGTRTGMLRVWKAKEGSLSWGPTALESPIRFLRFSRDGKQLFASSTVEQWAFNGDVASKNFFAVLEADSGRELLTSGPKGSTTNLICSHFSPDDRWLATAGNDHKIRVFDLSENRWIVELSGHTDEVRFLSFAANGSLLASASLDRTVRVWRLPSGESFGPILEHAFPAVRALLTSDGKHVLTACFEHPGRFFRGTYHSGQGEIQAWETSAGLRLGKPLRNRNWLVMFVDPARPERYFDNDHAYDFAAPGKPLYTLQPGPVQSWDFSPDGRSLALGESRNAARIFDTDSGELVAEPLPHGGSVTAIRYSPNGRQLLITGDEGTARLWDARPTSVESISRKLPEALGKIEPLEAAALLGQSSAQTAVPLQKELLLLNGNLQETARFALPPPGQSLSPLTLAWRTSLWITQEDKEALLLWRPKGSEPNPVRLPHRGEVLTRVFTTNDDFVVTSCRDGMVRFWNTKDGAMVRSVAVGDPGKGYVTDISPVGNLATWFSYNLEEQPFFRYVDLRSGTLLDPTQDLLPGPNSLSFAPNGSQLALWSWSGEVKVFGCPRGHVVSSSIRHSGNLLWVEWDPDSRRLLTAGANDEVLVWDARTGAQLLGPLRLPGGTIPAAHWSPDGRFIVALNEERTVRVWESSTGEAVTPLLKHSGDVLCARMLNNSRLLTASYPDLLRAWELKECRIPSNVLDDYAQLLSGRRLSESGTPLALKPEQLRALGRSLEVRAPALFQ